MIILSLLRQADILREVGKWIKSHGDAIYGTRGGPFYLDDWGVSTRKGNNAFLHILNLSCDELLLPPLEQKVVSAKFYDCGETVLFRQTEDNMRLIFPLDKRHKLDIIVILEFDSPVGWNCHLRHRHRPWKQW